MRGLLVLACLIGCSPALAAEPAPRPEGAGLLRLSPILLEAGFYDGLELDGFEVAFVDEVAPEIDGPPLPEPDEQRIRAKKKRFTTRYRMQERRFGVALQPSFAMLQGSVVGSAFDNGFAITLRGIAQISPANQAFLDIGYSRHDMKNPRPMFFRTAVTDDSGFSGQLEVFNPVLSFAFTFPLASGPRSKPMFIPKTYVGMGPMYTFAKGKVTNSGAKGTVTGHGTQPFWQFTPGIGLDVRVLDFFFVGVEVRERITLPTKRPSQTAEFSIPKLYVFEGAINFAYMFY